MEKFRIGNVVKDSYGNIHIVTGHSTMFPNTSKQYGLTNWISFDHENSSGSTRNFTYKQSQACFCIENNEGKYDQDCEDCHGRGSYDVDVKGIESWELLGRNVKEYIINSLTKNFNWT